MDDINSAMDLDQKIRNALSQKSDSNLPICLFFGEVSRDKLFLKLGFKSMRQYKIKLANEIGIKPGRLAGWTTIGTIYLKYKNDLEKAGFTESHELSKLRYLSKALKLHDKKDVYEKIITLSHKEFIDYASGNEKITLVSEKNPTQSNTGIFRLKGKTALTINPKIDPEIFSYLVRVNTLVFTAFRKKEKVYFMRVKDRAEFERFAKAFNRLIKRLRKGQNK